MIHETTSYDESFETRFDREPGEAASTSRPADSHEEPNGGTRSGRLLDEFLVEDSADQEPSGRRATTEEVQDDEENMSAWRPGRWIGN